MNKDLIDKFIRYGFIEYDYLEGDKSKRSKNFLLGFITSGLNNEQGRAATDEEELYIEVQIKDFLEIK